MSSSTNKLMDMQVVSEEKTIMEAEEVKTTEKIEEEPAPNWKKKTRVGEEYQVVVPSLKERDNMNQGHLTDQEANVSEMSHLDGTKVEPRYFTFAEVGEINVGGYNFKEVSANEINDQETYLVKIGGHNVFSKPVYKRKRQRFSAFRRQQKALLHILLDKRQPPPSSLAEVSQNH